MRSKNAFSRFRCCAIARMAGSGRTGTRSASLLGDSIDGGIFKLVSDDVGYFHEPLQGGRSRRIQRKCARRDWRRTAIWPGRGIQSRSPGDGTCLREHEPELTGADHADSAGHVQGSRRGSLPCSTRSVCAARYASRRFADRRIASCEYRGREQPCSLWRRLCRLRASRPERRPASGLLRAASRPRSARASESARPTPAAVFSRPPCRANALRRRRPQ